MKWTDKQNEARKLLIGPQTHTLLYGGSRSGKTYLFCYQQATRAIQAPASRRGILRLHFTDVKTAVAMDTFPKMMEDCYPKVKYRISKADWYAQMPDASEVWFLGLDDKERAEKVLGKEFATLLFNECSQIPYSSVEMALTRLAQSAKKRDRDVFLNLKAGYDCNPPKKGHWSYRQFHQKIHPITKKPLINPDDYAYMQINPTDNVSNLAPGYVDKILGTMSPAGQRRFLYGEFTDDNPNALFTDDNIELNRVAINEKLPDMIRLVVGVDPSGAEEDDNQDNDAIGIVVGGIGTDGKGYLLEDCTVKAGPATWGAVAASAYQRHLADCVVGEGNYGGAMVGFVVQTALPSVNFKKVTASRGKVVRAEPFSALYTQGKIRHAGAFPELEEELTGFSTVGYTGEGSPNRADAWIWVLTELFPQVAGLNSIGKYDFGCDA